jgi:hypothetical protein
MLDKLGSACYAGLKRKEDNVSELYQRLCEPFDHTFKDNRGGVELEYITGEQCISRLNEVLGVDGWSFVVLRHGINEEADEVWVLGEIAVYFGDRVIIRQQFGSQKIKRARSTGAPLDIGFDLKGAATDALKKCAQSLGVGLYLSRREPKEPDETVEETGDPVCAVCGEAIQDWTTPDGKTYTAKQLANISVARYGKVLCFKHRPQTKARRAG